MSARNGHLLRRRQWLVVRAAAQRNEVSVIAAQLKKRLRWVDRGFAVGQVLRAHPVLAVTGVSLLLNRFKSRRLRLLRPSRLFTLWELLNVVRRQWRAY